MAATWFNTIANYATELSWCDCSAEVEMQRPEAGNFGYMTEHLHVMLAKARCAY